MIGIVNSGDTIIALATPQGEGAIGVIRLSGTDAISMVNQFFPNKNLLAQETHTIHLGTIRNESDHLIDEVLVSLFVTPKSYTKENVVEISCHGSSFIIQQIIELFLRNGARMAKQGEFTMRAYLNGQMDLSQAEAVADLIASNSASSHEIAMKQMRGGFSNEIKDLRKRLIDFSSLIELELDFGEEDVEFADRDDLRKLVTEIHKLVRRLSDSFRIGNVVKNGVSTVIAGRPNAGKSTLLNALLNEERAIVSEIAGTTRDTIEEVLNINGIAFRLIDTAGIRDASDQIEAIGVSKTMEKIEQSAIMLYMYDRTTQTILEVNEDLSKLKKQGLRVLVVGNKSDAVEGNTTDESNPFEDLPYLFISAKDKTQLAQLKSALYEIVVSKDFSFEETIVTNLRHYDALERAGNALQDVITGMDNGITGDFLAQDIRHALIYLGEITGEIELDRDILGNIFGKFCIGK